MKEEFGKVLFNLTITPFCAGASDYCVLRCNLITASMSSHDRGNTGVMNHTS